MAQVRVAVSCSRCGHTNRIDILPYCGPENTARGHSEVACEGCGRIGSLRVEMNATPTGDVSKPEMPPRGRYILGWDCAFCRRFGNGIVLDPSPEPGEYTSACLLCGTLHQVRLHVAVDYAPDPTVTCPCCGYVTLHQPRAWEICGICFWEDEETLGDPDWVTGANRLSLRQAQRNVARFGACDERALPFVRRPRPCDRKDPDWRPVD